MSYGETLMRKIAAAFEVGDLRPLMDAIHKDIVWKSGSTQMGLFRFSGVHNERSGVQNVTANIAKKFIFKKFQPREIVGNDDVIWGLFDAEIAYDVEKNDAPPQVTLEIAVRWRLKDGKIIEHQGFFDTMSLLSQMGA